MAQLNWCPQIEWDGHLLRLSLPCRPWVPVSRGIGGSEVSAAGVPAAYEIRRDRLERVTLRVLEDEWEQVEQWLEWAQRTALPFRWRFDQDDPATAVTCYLEAPAMGDPIEPHRSADFGSVLEITIDLRYTEVYRPLYYPGARDPTPDLPDLLWRWRAGWAGGSFSRSSSAWYIGPDGVLHQAASGVPRIEWYDLDGDGVRETPTLLLEHASTNLVPNVNGRPANMSAFGTTPPTVQVEARQTPFGSECWAITFPNPVTTGFDGSRATSEPDRFAITAGLPYARTLWVAGDTTGIRIYHTGVSALIDLAPTGRQIEVGGLVWREFTGASTPGASGMEFLAIYASTTSAAGKTIRIAGHQVEQAPVPSSLILGSPAPVTRAADALTFPWPHAPQAMTGYLRFVERGAIAYSDTRVLLQIGTGGVQPRLLVAQQAGEGRYRVFLSYGAGVASVLPATPVPVIGDRVELLWRLYADGSVQIEQSINGGTPVVAARSSAVGLPAAWSAQLLRLSGVPNGESEAPAAWRDAALFKGTDITWDEIRALVGT